MGKRKARKRKAGGFRTAAKGRSAVPRSRATTFGRPDLLILLGLAVMTFAIYAQVIGHQFITLDDDGYIKENAMVNRGVTLAGVAWAFTAFDQGNWHPLTWIAHMIDSQLFGMNAGGHLLVNALIHVANTLLVFWFLLRTTHTRWPSALVAALFGLAFADRLRALCKGALEQPIRVHRHNACLGTIGQTDAGHLAFRNVATRLMAVAPLEGSEGTSAWRFPQGSSYRDCATGVGEIAVVRSHGGVR